MAAMFDDRLKTELVDRAAFKFGHNLQAHPALTLENLSKVIPALPLSQVMYSNSLLKTGDDFESTFSRRPSERSLAETVEAIRHSDAYIMVQSPEAHASFAELKRELQGEVEKLIRGRGVGTAAIDCKLYLFIASPNSVTPFHIDRYSTFLMQIRGSKTVTVFPQWDEGTVRAADREAYVAYANTKLPWTPEIDRRGTAFQFSPGEALHIPFIAGHHVKNGPDDVSISMSIIFNTEESMRWRRALLFNHMARRVLGKVGISPPGVGSFGPLDAARSGAWRAMRSIKKLAG